MKNKIVFLGSAEFSVPILLGLNGDFQIVAVLTQPDRPSGRGGRIEISPIKKAGLSLGLQIFQPEKIKAPEFIHVLSELKPDLIVVAAYGQILSKQLLDLPRLGCINVHASLLPRWRGASPIQAAILAGDAVTGITIMKMDEGLDTGPILAQKEMEIAQEDDAQMLSFKLSRLGAELLEGTLKEYFVNRIVPQTQKNENATQTRLIRKEDGRLDFNLPAYQLERMVRAYHPWPGAYFAWGSLPIKVIKAHVMDVQGSAVGRQRIIEEKPACGTPNGYLVLDQIQPAGKRSMAGKDFLNGVKNWLN
jgi:methionyl-tRNA formyltransferase